MTKQAKTPLEIAISIDPRLVSFFDALDEAIGHHPRFYPYSWRAMPDGYDAESCEHVMRGFPVALKHFVDEQTKD